jgi:hypothetical protein
MMVAAALLFLLFAFYLASWFVPWLELAPDVIGMLLALVLMVVSRSMRHARWWYFASDVCLLVTWVLIGMQNMEWISWHAPVAVLAVGMGLLLVAWVKAKRSMDRESREIFGKGPFKVVWR